MEIHINLLQASGHLGTTAGPDVSKGQNPAQSGMGSCHRLPPWNVGDG